MTQDQVAGSARSGFGKVQSAMGDALNDEDMQASGEANDIIGDVQEYFGKVVDRVTDAKDQLDDLLTDGPYKALGLAVGLGLLVGFVLGRSGRKVVYVRG